MKIVCLDLEGVLVPEIWITFSEATGIKELHRTTRDEPDYDKLMRFRIDILKENDLKLFDIQKVISGMKPLAGAVEFVKNLREKTQVIILSDTFEQFANPLMEKLSWPSLFCNSLIIADDGSVTGYTLRQNDGKRKAVAALKSINMKVFAAGDSYNDLAMIREADAGCLIHAPDSIRKECANIDCVDSLDALMEKIDGFLVHR
jgi:phosphoserine/homoserine phosphotransferase